MVGGRWLSMELVGGGSSLSNGVTVTVLVVVLDWCDEEASTLLNEIGEVEVLDSVYG